METGVPDGGNKAAELVGNAAANEVRGGGTEREVVSARDDENEGPYPERTPSA